ncbi:MAG: HEAT repeat domain-containing protein [Nitrospinota bacterium]|nr:HEAT repeat domain-containing protein [Nitrospinota bacterium]
MDSQKYWELDGYLKIDNSFLKLISEQVLFPFSKHFHEYPITTALILSVFLLIGITVFLFFYVVYLRIKLNRYQILKARRFASWEQDILPLVLDDADISDFIKTIKKSEYELFGEFISPYLNDIKGDGLARMINILREIGVVQKEQYHLKNSKSTWRRALAVQRLGAFKDPNNVKDIVKALHDKEITVTLNAAGALLKMGDRRLLEKVISVLLKNELITEELFAEVLLKFERSINLEAFLSQEIDKYPMPPRFKIINLIEPIISAENEPDLIARLKNTKKAISIILEDEDLAEELVDEIIHDYENNNSINLEKILNKKEKEYSVASRIKLIDFIGYINRVEGIPVLIDILKKPKDDEETISVIKALGHLEAEESTPLLLDHLKSEHPVIRAQSAKALGVLKNESTAKPISRLLEDKDWWCRFHAASSIHQMGEAGRECLQSFFQHTKDPYAKGIITQFLSKPQ